MAENAEVVVRRWWIRVAVAALIVGGFFYSLRKSTSELPVYTTGGERMAAGEEIYRPGDHKPFTYPPFFAVPFVPFTALPESVHRGVWYFVNIAVLIAILMMFHAVMRPYTANGPPRRRFWLLTILLAGVHLSAVLENQSHDLLVLGLVMLGLYAGSGCAFGLATACKATPLLFLPVLCLQRRFRAALAMVVAIGAATLLPDLVFPRADGGLWIVAWYETFVAGIGVGRPAEADGAWRAWNLLDQGLGGTLYRLSRPGPGQDVSLWAPSAATLRAVTLAAQALVVAVIGWAAWPRPGGDARWRRIGETGLVVCGMVLLSPMSSKSHFCVLLIPMGYCAAAVLYRAPGRSLKVMVALVFLLGTLTMRDLVGSTIANESGARGSVTWCAVFTLAATATVLRKSAT